MSIGVTAPIDLVEVEDDRLEHLLAREREELLGQLRGPCRGALDLVEVARSRADADPVAGHAAVAGDHGQQVVEVVRDAARELADGLHLLRLPELALEPLALAHVLGDDAFAPDVRRTRPRARSSSP